MYTTDLPQWKKNIRDLRLKEDNEVDGTSGIVSRKQRGQAFLTLKRNSSISLESDEAHTVRWMTLGYYIGHHLTYGNPPNSDPQHWTQKFADLLANPGYPRKGSGTEIEIPVKIPVDIILSRKQIKGMDFSGVQKVMSKGQLEAATDQFNFAKGLTGGFEDSMFTAGMGDSNANAMRQMLQGSLEGAGNGMHSMDDEMSGSARAPTFEQALAIGEGLTQPLQRSLPPLPASGTEITDEDEAQIRTAAQQRILGNF